MCCSKALGVFVVTLVAFAFSHLDASAYECHAVENYGCHGDIFVKGRKIPYNHMTCINDEEYPVTVTKSDGSGGKLTLSNNSYAVHCQGDNGSMYKKRNSALAYFCQTYNTATNKCGCPFMLPFDIGLGGRCVQ